MNKVSFCIVGCGAIAQRHAKHIQAQGLLLAVCDINSQKAQQLASQYNCQYFTNYTQMLEAMANRAMVVSICTPNGCHAKHTIEALQKGFHVVCEKPMALSVAEANAMVNVAQLHQKKLFIVKQNRYNEPVVAVKNLLQQNALGKILGLQLNCFWNRNEVYYTQSDWKGTLDLDGGILYTQFSHFIDILIWYFGEIKVVSAIAQNLNHKSCTAFADTIACTIQLPNQAIGTIYCSTNAYGKNMEGSITILGEKGTVKIGGEYLNVLEYQQIENVVLPNIQPTYKPNNYGTYTGTMSNHDKVYNNVIDVLQNGVVKHVQPKDGVEAIQLIEQINKAIQ